jgi:signal transduction histidine kinase
MQAGSGARRLLTISGVFALTALVTTTTMIAADRTGAIHEAQQRNAVLVQVIEEHARRAFDISKASLIDLDREMAVSGRPNVMPPVAARMANWISDVPQIYSFWLIDAKGRVMHTTQPVDSTGFDFSDREYFKVHRDGNDWHVGRMTLGRIDKVWFFSLSKRLTDQDGTFQGVLVASMRVDFFTALYQRLGLSANDNVAIYRLDGAVVARRLGNWTGEVGPSGAGHPVFTEYFPKSPSGVFEAASTIDRVVRVGAYRGVEDWPLIVTSVSDKDKLLKAWRSRARHNAAYCAAVLLSLGFMTWWGYRRVSGEARALKALHEGERRFKVALADSPVVVFEQDLDLRYTWIYNPKLGLSVEDVIGKTDAEIMDPACLGPIEAIKRSAIDTGRPIRQEIATAAPGKPIEYYDLHVEPRRNQCGRIIGITCAASDITDMTVSGRLAARAKAEAERAVLARSKFLASASHDLRQPAQSLALLLGVLKLEVRTASASKAVGLMENALEGLNGLLTSILDVSRLDAGVVMPQMATVDIGALLGRLAQEYSLLAEGKGLRLKAVRLALMARTDASLLERILRNLMENAIRYTHRGGILVGMRRRGNRVRLDVVDSGIGIPSNELPHIFEELYQVGNPGRHFSEGLGLGLAIVERLARLLGAELLVRSREGRGTCFSLLLPLDGGQCRLAETPQAVGDIKGRVLIIEDDATVRTGLQLLAESWGHEVVVVASGEEALDLCAAEGRRFDAILADHRLGPGLNGTESAKQIRSQAGWPIPTLIVTGDTAPERISEVHASGFEILHKPVAAEELRQKLAQLLRGG